MNDTALTPRQRQILQLIERLQREVGMPPTRAEIAAHFGFRSANAAEEHLRALARKGSLELKGGQARGIRLLTSNEPVAPRSSRPRLPLIGRVAAGAPLLAQAHVERQVELDPQLFRPAADYLLRVRGFSMRDAGILDGDWLAVHRTPQAQNGQIVVVRLGEEVTVKRFERRGTRARLWPANPDFAPIDVDLGRQELSIEGLVVGVVRRFGLTP
jgi:repressor LexA